MPHHLPISLPNDYSQNSESVPFPLAGGKAVETKRVGERVSKDRISTETEHIRNPVRTSWFADH